jgi:GNAT superfamily N-acetyltransferase
VRRATLTPEGRAEWSELDARSEKLAAAVLRPLGERQRERLVEAMATVERLLTASTIEIAVEDPRTRDARWCLAQYFAELERRFDAGFDPALSTLPDADVLVPPAGLLLVARLRGRPVGCGALRFDGAAVDVKRMWVAGEVRGLGLGRRLLQELEAKARDTGANVIRLETNRSLVEAIALYRASGYVEVEPFNDEAYAHHWFAKPLAE